MNSGIIISNNIKLISKIVLTYTNHRIRFSCCTPLFINGSILEGKYYKFRLFVPKKIINDLSINTFCEPYHKDYVYLKFCDMLDETNKIRAKFYIGDKVETHCNMYVLETTIFANTTICYPVLFICGTLIKDCNALKCVDISQNNACGIYFLIDEVCE